MAMLSLLATPMHSATVQAASTLTYAAASTTKKKKVSISSKKATLTVGDKKVLKLKNTSKKPKWKSSNKTIASVSRKGTVTAKKAGKATITATLGKKKYTCKITVKAMTPSKTLDKILKEVKDAYGDNYYPNIPIDKIFMEDKLGLKSNQYDTFVGEEPMISFHVDKFIAIHPTKGNKDDVEKALKNYKDYLLTKTHQYPVNIPKITAAKVVTIDDYVFFLMLGKPCESTTSEAAILKHYEEQNEIAVKAIKKVLK